MGAYPLSTNLKSNKSIQTQGIYVSNLFVLNMFVSNLLCTRCTHSLHPQYMHTGRCEYKKQRGHLRPWFWHPSVDYTFATRVVISNQL
jgi:hypothetical protein